MGADISRRVIEYRKAAGLTQEKYGRKYGVSGPAIFKFENNFVTPNLPLWLRIASDNGLGDRRAVLIWIRDRLPEDYKHHVDPDASAEEEESTRHNLDYTAFSNRDAMREAVYVDDSIPIGLKDMIRDDEIWSLYKPTGQEINFLRNTYGHMGSGTVENYRDALRVARAFLSYAGK